MGTIKRLSQDNYDKIFQLSQFAFQYHLSEKELADKKEEAARHKIWGYMEGDNLAAKLHVIPLTTLIGGEPFAMGGISSVATWPEYRRQGIVKQLLFHALQEMKQAGQTMSYLHPFSFAFYRQYGWEHVFNQKHYTIPVNQLRGMEPAEGYVRRLTSDLSLLDDIYTDYAKLYSGMIIRDAAWWRQRVFKQQHQLVVAYSEAGDAEGYLHYQVKDNHLTVHELAYRHMNGWKLLLEFIANHDSMVDTVTFTVPENDSLPEIVDEPDFQQQIKPYFMARIVDVFAFLEKYPFKAVTSPEVLMIEVEDDFFPDNKGIYELNHHGDYVSVVRVVSKGELKGNQPPIRCSIQQLTKIFMGYKRAPHLYELGLIDGTYAEAEKLDRWIPQIQTFYTQADFF